jgi:putative colanic acid biosynthesis UDP-glucose lipid carrier transferase
MLAVNKKFIRSQLFSDLVIIIISFIISASLAQSFQLFFVNYLLFLLLIVLLAVWYFSAKITGAYDNITLSPFLRFTAILKNIFIQGFTEIVFIFISKELLFTRNFVLFYILLLVILIPLKTFLITKYFRVRKESGNNFNKLLIVGTGELGRNFYNQFTSYSNLDYRIAGFVDKIKNNISDNLYLGSIEMLEKIIQQEGIDDVVLALDVTELQNYSKIIRICNNAAVRVHILPDYFQFMTKNLSLSAFDDFPIITLRTILLDQFHWKFIKRAFDLVFSLFVLVLIGSWLFLLIAIIEKLTSRGPVFYIQDRVGQKNKLFKCFKFRTMTVDPKRELSFNPTMKNEMSITGLGRFLRKTNLDELPQFINVLFGNMSVVGPRPHAVQFDKKYSEFIEEIKLRHIVKPGITGWAQIHGLRGDSLNEDENKKNTRERIQHDIWYIENWSFGTDIQIIFLTVFQILKGKAKGF